MSSVAVIAHKKKTFGGGLDELRSRLADAGVTDLIWREVPKSKRAPGAIREALDAGADLVFVWGGDGTVQRCADTLAGSGVAMAILPAGTANRSRRTSASRAIRARGRRRAARPAPVPRRRALERRALRGDGRRGIRRTHDPRRGRHAEGPRGEARLRVDWRGNLDGPRMCTTITVDGRPWFRGKTSCVLVGNVSHVVGGLQVFDGAGPTMAASNSVSSPPGRPCSGRASSCASSQGARSARVSCGSRAARRSTSGSPTRRRTSSTVALAAGPDT